MKAETKLTHDIIRTLNGIPGVLVWRRNVGRRGGVRFGKAGQVDIEGVIRGGRRVELEVKIETEPTAAQLEWLDDMARMGAVTGIVRSIWEAVDIIEAALRQR